MRSALGARAAAGACALAAACGGEESTGRESEASEPRARHLLLVVADTLRADHLSAYGYPRETSPRIAELAARGVRFEQVTSQFQETRPSHVALLASLRPTAVGLMSNDVAPCPADVTTLAEVLAGAGFDTAAIVGNALLTRDFGLDQGFAAYDDRLTSTEANRPGFGEKRADVAADAAIAFLEQAGGRRFFLFLHFQDAHGPYLPPAGFARRFEGDGIVPATGIRVPAGKMPRYQALGDRTDHDHYVAQYDGEIAFLDHELGRVLDALERRGLAEETLVVFTADHGEAMGERGLYYLHHMPMVYEEVMRLPWILAGPGVARGRVIADLAQSIDVMPTALDLLGVSGPEAMQGRSRVDLLDAGRPPPKPSVVTSADSIAPEEVVFAFGREDLALARAGRFKLVAHPLGNRLFDLDADPAEKKNVAAAHPQVFARLLDLLARRRAADAAFRAQLAEASLTPEQAAADRARLDALGYTERR